MKILFITSTYEQGKDGVGDYVRMLVSKCKEEGIACGILALHDAFTKEVISFQEEMVSVLRLPISLSNDEKKRLGKTFVFSLLPDWVSIQFVAYGYHPRGFVFGLPTLFRHIIPEASSIHIMFHELWLGFASNHPLKEKLIGRIQKYWIHKLWMKLAPQVIHVSNDVYYSILKQEKLSVSHLPLPANIPIVLEPKSEWIRSELAIKNREEFYVVIIFGTIHKGWDVSEVFSYIKSQMGNKKLYVVSVGGQGYGKEVWDAIVSLQSEKMVVKKLGFRSDEQVSELLQFADAGLATTPLSLIGKSGSAMAMIEHGLPLLVTRNELVYSFPIEKVEDIHPTILMWHQFDLRKAVRHPLQMNRLKDIADKFLKDLSVVN